ncbi:GGDEF domain-containing protein [Salinisphaera orenii]|nr:GGDEF domain-containing protein [Salinisphaera halophila]
MAGASYTMPASIAFAAAMAGELGWTPLLNYLLTVTALLVAFYVVFRTGANLRFAEPGLTTAQVMAPLPPGLYLMYHVGSHEARAAMLLTVIVPLFYGLLDFGMRRFLGVTAVYFVAYCALFAVLAWHQPELLRDPDEWIMLIAMAALMVQLGLIGGFVSDLRDVLRRKNRELGEALTRIADMAVHDELTGVYNRHHLVDVLRREVSRAGRGDAVFSVCLMDIDLFKQVNDRHGHLVADEVLRRCARHVESRIRDIDTFGRYGGEEFLLVLPATGAPAARDVAERLRRELADLEFANDAGERFGITVSVGVAVSPRSPSVTVDALLHHADAALYDAKNSGRNRVCSAAAPG